MKDFQFRLHEEMEEKHWWFVGRRRLVRRVLEHAVAPSSEKLVIDVGCGTGANIAFLDQDYTGLGIDSNALAIESARRRFPDTEFLCGVAPNVAGERWQQARAILLMDVLEHIEDDFLFFSQLLADLTPGTHVLITVPALRSLWSPHDLAFGHYRRYEIPRLARLWKGLPITPLLVSFFMSRLYPLVKLARMVSRRRGRAAGNANTDFRLPCKPCNWMLTKILAGEAPSLQQALDQAKTTGSPPSSAYRKGVSLLAILRREPGTIIPRQGAADLSSN
jgi:SAM-dependent methyltransferase